MTLLMETQSQTTCCQPGAYATNGGCVECPTGYVSQFGEEYCNACDPCKKEYSPAGASFCQTCGSSPGEYWMQMPGAVTGDCVSCPTGEYLAVGYMFRRRLQIPGGDSESDNYNQRKLGMKTRIRKLEQMYMPTGCNDYEEKNCDTCHGKSQHHQK